MPVVQLGCYVLPGRVSDPRGAITDAIEAEALGYDRVWLSERYDVKEAGVVLGAMGARTERIGLGTGLLAEGARHPLLTAALAATMQAMFGDRFVLGLGRGFSAILKPQGIRDSTMQDFGDHVDIVRRLLRGETVTYSGPIGEFPALRLVDLPDTLPPPIVYGAYGGPRSAEVAARSCDALMLPGFLTPDAVRGVRSNLDAACDRIGRDPRELRLLQNLVVATELPDDQVKKLVHARAVTYFTIPGGWQPYQRQNGWPMRFFQELHAHPLFANLSGGGAAEQEFRREDLLSPADMIPEEWMRQTAAIGSLEDGVRVMRSYVDAGTDEFIFHGASPSQSAALLNAWRAAEAVERNEATART